MDRKLALYSGAVFAGVLLAGALVVKPGFSGPQSGADPNTAETAGNSGQTADSSGFVARLTRFVHADDDEDREHEEGTDHEEDDD